jgi:hypothetical protein
MKILKHGNKNVYIWKCKCLKCGCVAECNEDELNNIIEGDYRSDYKSFCWMPCPEPFCNNNVLFYRK